MSDPFSVVGDYNNRTKFDFSFFIRSTSEDENILTQVEAVPCKDAIYRTVSDETQRDKMLAIYGSQIDDFVCPDLDSFELFVPNWLDFSYKHMKEIFFSVKVNPGYSDYLN